MPRSPPAAHESCSKGERNSSRQYRIISQARGKGPNLRQELFPRKDILSAILLFPGPTSLWLVCPEWVFSFQGLVEHFLQLQAGTQRPSLSEWGAGALVRAAALVWQLILQRSPEPSGKRSMEEPFHKNRIVKGFNDLRKRFSRTSSFNIFAMGRDTFC